MKKILITLLIIILLGGAGFAGYTFYVNKNAEKSDAKPVDSSKKKVNLLLQNLQAHRKKKIVHQNQKLNQ